MDKFEIARKLERLAAKLRKEAQSSRLASDETEFSDGLGAAYDSAARDVMKLADELFAPGEEIPYRSERLGIRAFVHAGQPWPLSDEIMKKILADEERPKK